MRQDFASSQEQMKLGFNRLCPIRVRKAVTCGAAPRDPTVLWAQIGCLGRCSTGCCYQNAEDTQTLLRDLLLIEPDP